MGHSKFNGSQYTASSEDDRSLRERFYRFMESLAQRVKRDGLRLFLLVLANGFYLYVGGMVFYLLERREIPIIDTRKQVIDLIQAINQEVKSSNISRVSPEDNLIGNLTSKQTLRLELMLEHFFEERHKSERSRWTVMNSVFFASTVVTTIGYGNLAPQTAYGRAFCVIYAVFGIPLTLILLAIVGKILAKYINDFCGLVVQSLRRYFYPDYTYDSTDGETDLNAPVWLAMLLITIFLTFDAVVFMFMEKWSFGTSLYFIFITLTTIGFGDIVPQNSEAVWFNVTFLYIGLAAVSITINLFIANISIQFRRHKNKFQLVKHWESELDSEADGETTPLTRETDNSKDVESARGTQEKTTDLPFEHQSKETSDSYDSRPKRKTSRVRFQTDD